MELKFKLKDNRKYEVEVDIIDEEVILSKVDRIGVKTPIEMDDIQIYTGIRDINGKEIYTGDYVHTENTEGVVYYDKEETSIMIKPYHPNTPYEILGLASNIEITGI